MDVASRFRLVCAAAIAFVVAAGPTEAIARGGVVEAQLDYLASLTCPTSADFETIVSGRLGYDPFTPDAPEQVTVRIEAAGSALEGRIEWKRASGERAGERRFPSRSGDCRELVRAMGFALALQIQLMATDAIPVEAPRSVAPIAAEPPTVVAPPPTAVVSNPRPSNEIPPIASPSAVDPSVWAGLGASVGLGISPDATPLGALFVRATWPALAVEVAAEASSLPTLRRSDGTGFSERLLLSALTICGTQTRWSGCVVGKIGEIRVRGEGVDLPATASGLVLQAGIRLSAAQNFGSRASVALHADGLANLARGTVKLDAMPVWASPPFAAIVGLRLYVRFR